MGEASDICALTNEQILASLRTMVGEHSRVARRHVGTKEVRVAAHGHDVAEIPHPGYYMFKTPVR